LLQDDIHSALQTADNNLFEPISIPYARYTIFLCLANIELAVSKGDYLLGLALSEDLLKEVFSLTRVDIPDVLRWKGKALSGLGRLNESYQVLKDAGSLARESGCILHLWTVLADLASLNSKLGNDKEAEENRREARHIAEQIAESLREVGLRDSFLDQPRVKTLMR
ncbi:MAG TPA: hypothetical protein VN843_33370, partial [Anaerolineales bacterium]|nr:hypothetical protein [Anaerolineales bacterium]